MKLLIAVLQHYDHLIHLDFQCGRISQPTTSGSNSASISSKIHLECTQDAIHGLVHNILWPQNARSHIYTLHWRPGLQGYWESISISTTSERETFLWATCRCRPHHARWLGLGKRGSKSNGLGMCVQTLSLPVVTYQYISWVSGGIVIQKKMLRHEKTLTPHYICRWLPKLKAHAERKLVVHDMTSCTGKWNSQFIQKRSSQLPAGNGSRAVQLPVHLHWVLRTPSFPASHQQDVAVWSPAPHVPCGPQVN